MTEQSNDNASNYDVQARQNGWYPEVLFGLCYEYLRPGDRLLDIGTGTGLAAEAFAKAGLRVYGMDSSAEMLSVFRAKGIAADLKQHDVLTIPWPYADETFDHLLASGVLHFLADLEPVFREAGRILRPGGIFVFTTKAPPHDEPAPYLCETIQGTTLYLHQHAYLERVMSDSGFSPLKEMLLLVRTGQGTEDVFPALVTHKRI